MKTREPLWAYRLAVGARTLVAVVGGWSLTAACAAALSLGLAQRLPRVEAVLWATQLAWLIYPLAVAWAFWARTLGQATAGVLGPALVLGLLAWLPHRLGA